MRIYRTRKFPTKLFLLILIITIILLNPKLITGFKNFTFGILIKPLKAISGVKIYFKRIKNLSEENLLLKQRVASLSIELTRKKEISLENERLRSLLDFKNKEFPHYKTIISKIIARDSTDWRRAIIINKGARDGIRKYASSATAKGLIGTVVEIGPSSSKVMLITDPNSRVGVIIEPSRESGVLIGSPEGECRVIYLSLDAKIERGDMVKTCGFSAFFPKGIAIGTVREIGLEKTGLYKYAVVDPFEDMGRLEEVVCIDTD
ncbi:MAG: rod shape-determining protein MreC [Candidatus Omnitrophota bacterium]|nr:MAG: rod shape-determining protein MreC [Candidatus Omnitrophota bacterium]